MRNSHKHTLNHDNASRQTCFIGIALLNLFLIGPAWGAQSGDSPLPHGIATDKGREIYSQHCTKCHGDRGQGNDDEYDEALYGDRSIKSLARLIERTMPEDEPELVTGTAAEQVASYIYHAFYSPAAREAIVPKPRIELTRLTVSQYRNSIADLVGSFTSDATQAEHSEIIAGFEAEYFQSKGMNKADKLGLERIDSVVDFDYDTGSPAENISAEQFSAIWQGSLRAHDTGYYEFRVSTPNGARLYLNAENTGKRRKMRDDSSVAGQKAIIDAWVSSGKMRQHTTRVFLLGGRHYPIRLEFFKYKEEVASIKFEWKQPKSTWSLLDDRFVHTHASSRTFVVDTPFPADDRSAGYERGSSVSASWHNAVTQGAIATASEIVDRLPTLANVADNSPERLSKLQSFTSQFATRAFRRPLETKERTLFEKQLFESTPNPETAIRRAVLLILTSPSFLYVLPTDDTSIPDQNTIASRLALTLWDSLPDPQLNKAVLDGKLASTTQIKTQIHRMLKDERARSKIQQFFHHWLEIEDRDLSKDLELFPNFDESVMNDLRYSLDLFIEKTVWSDKSDYRELLLTDQLLLNKRLAELYGTQGSAPQDAPSNPNAFVPISFSNQRAGILTHPFLLSAFSYHDTTSPIHRGVFLTRNVMGRGLKPPPIAVAFKNDEFPDDLSMREKITRLTRDAACMTCHSIINPLGFALENYDAVGRWRTTENDRPVDTASEYITIEGDSREFKSAHDLARFAATSETAHGAFVAHLFRHLLKQTPEAYGREIRDELRLHFVENEFNIQKLIAEIALVTAMHSETEEVTESAL